MAFPRVTRDHLLFAACGGVFVIFLQQLALYIRPKIESETSARNRSQNDEKAPASSASKGTEKKKVQGSEPETGFAEKFLKGKSLIIPKERIKLRLSIFKFRFHRFNHSSFTHKFHGHHDFAGSFNCTLPYIKKNSLPGCDKQAPATFSSL
jgi:hypothetical protein